MTLGSALLTERECHRLRDALTGRTHTSAGVGPVYRNAEGDVPRIWFVDGAIPSPCRDLWWLIVVTAGMIGRRERYQRIIVDVGDRCLNCGELERD